jgi:iron complex transport system ATP-binding protein
MMQAFNIQLHLRGRHLLRGVHLSVLPGRFTAVAGPNGAGKSSLLKVLSHEYTHYEGKVRVNGRAMRDYRVAELAAVRAVLPQQSHVQFPFSVKQVVEMGLAIHRKKFRSTLLPEVMALTGIAGWQERNYLTLSGGEQQRVQLARVLAQVWEETDHARYILLDEPTSSLDIAQQQLIFDVVKQACQRNIGVMAIVHDLNQVAQFADDLYFLRDGQVVAQGNTNEVFTKRNIEETFCCRVNVYRDPCTQCPYIVPDKNQTTSLTTVTL